MCFELEDQHFKENSKCKWLQVHVLNLTQNI